MNSSLVYCIACCARSGSTFLAELCESTGRLGYPREYINPDPMCEPRFRRKMSVASDAPDALYVNALLAQHRTANGVFGFKVVNYEEHKLRLAEFPINRWIFLRRRDQLEQAISLYKAIANKQWVWRAGEAKPSPPFDAKGILGTERYLIQKHAEWLEYFNDQSIKPLELWYEEIQDEPQHAIKQVCDYVGVSSENLPSLKVTTRVQRDAVTDEWKQQLAAVRHL